MSKEIPDVFLILMPERRYRELGREKRWNLRKLSGCD